MRKIFTAAVAIGALAFAIPGSAAGSMLSSWYGPGFHGRLTANGERYDMHGLTAAHKNYLSAQNYVFATKDAWMYVSMIAVLTLVLVSLICLTEPPKQLD